ncbi:hypothetical protein J3P96_15980 [Pseudomonas sp. R3-56]|uniref:preATP grasp domain-containing protein n=1 Tax=Pseudomonas sp. R3-56 TaxID=2817401 RepID=UPI003DA8C616
MPKIIIGNVDNESMLGDRSFLSYDFKCGTAMAASRLAWIAEEGDIIILPLIPNTEMQEYMDLIKGRRANSITFIQPQWGDQEFTPLTEEILLSKAMITEIKKAMVKNADWTLLPYMFDRTITALARELSISEGDSSIGYLAEGGGEILNDKALFRAMAANRGTNLALGQRCGSLAQLTAAFSQLIEVTGALIIKQDKNSSADGNVIVSIKPLQSTQGSSVCEIIDHSDIKEAANRTWCRLSYAEAATLIVEAYYEVEKILYMEFYADQRLRKPVFLNWGEQRMEPLFRGFVIPPELPGYQAATFSSGATELARMCLDMGFQGLLDVDGIVTTDGEIIFNEINARAGGCSHFTCNLRAFTWTPLRRPSCDYGA